MEYGGNCHAKLESKSLKQDLPEYGRTSRTRKLPSICQDLPTGILRNDTQEVEENIYVVRELTKPLLGRPAIEQLALIRRIAAIDKINWNKTSCTAVPISLSRPCQT